MDYKLLFTRFLFCVLAFVLWMALYVAILEFALGVLEGAQNREYGYIPIISGSLPFLIYFFIMAPYVWRRTPHWSSKLMKR